MKIRGTPSKTPTLQDGRGFTFRGIPAANRDDIGSLYQTVEALVEVVETLSGARGQGPGRGILMADLLNHSDDPMKRVQLEGIFNYLRANRFVDWADDHVAVVPPDKDPHPQYWHKVLDPAGGSMSIYSAKAFTAGQTIAPWDSAPVAPYMIAGDTLVGAFTVDGSARMNGVYAMSIYLDLSGGNRAEHTFDFYVNGVPTGNPFRLRFGNQQTDGSASWNGLVTINASSPAEVTFRNVTASDPFTVVSADWSMHRLAHAGDAFSAFVVPQGIHIRGQFNV
jgi:hypothetical protein